MNEKGGTRRHTAANYGRTPALRVVALTATRPTPTRPHPPRTRSAPRQLLRWRYTRCHTGARARMNVCGRQAVTRVRNEERVSRLRPTHAATHKQTEAARQQREDASSGSQAQREGREQRGHGCPQPPHIGHNLRGKPGSAHAPIELRTSAVDVPAAASPAACSSIEQPPPTAWRGRQGQPIVRRRRQPRSGERHQG